MSTDPKQTPSAPKTKAIGYENAPVADLRTLRALGHPLRAALLDAIRLYGPLTATQAAERVDDSPSNCSFHLRTLAAANLIEQAPSEDGRSRPWRSVTGPLILGPGDTAETHSSFRAATQIMYARVAQGASEWVDQERFADEEWRQAAFSSMLTIRMSAAELEILQGQINALLEPLIADQARKSPDPTGERQPVRLSLIAYPALSTPNERQHPPKES